MKPPLSERRKYPRVSESVSCQISVGLSSTLSTVTQNLSCGGALCILPESVAPMTKLAVSLELPDASRIGGSPRQRVRCTGVVIRQDKLLQAGEPPPYLTAIYFSELKEEDRRRIGEFILQSMLAHDRRRS